MFARRVAASLLKCAKPSLLESTVKPCLLESTSSLYIRGKATTAAEELKSGAIAPSILSVLPAPHQTAKVIFDNHQTADFKYIWLRDNCRCPKCIDVSTKQKLVNTKDLNVNIRPKALLINDDGQLEIKWMDQDGSMHVSKFDSKWLHKYGQSFIHSSFESDSIDIEHGFHRPDIYLWNRAKIWENLPELSYNEFMESDEGLRTWLEMFYRFGIGILRGVPVKDQQVAKVVKRFAYVKETQYGHTFDVVSKPQKDTGTHLAYSGRPLDLHTDMNYREKSPGMQLLHCHKAHNPKLSGSNLGGRSLFVDGFRAAKWMEDNEPSAFHILTSTPVRFSIKNDGLRYSALWPILLLDPTGDVQEIHYNNRTMQPLQAPAHVVVPFYHAYKLFSNKLAEDSYGLEFQMLPGDLVAFNNRRVLHGRSSFDPKIADRFLQGCYVDIDEAISKFDQLQMRYNETKDNQQ